MEHVGSNKGILFELLLVILPLTVQIYNIVASKLGIEPFPGNLISLIVLLAASLFVYFRHTKLLSNIPEYKIAIIFVIVTIPTILSHLNSDIDNIVRSFCSVLFVPLGFAVGVIIKSKIHNTKKTFFYNLILLLPMFSVAAMIQSMPMLVERSEFGRDAILAVSIFLPIILNIKNKYLKNIFLIIVLYWSIISAKRTSLLCIGLAFVFLIISNISHASGKNFVKFIVVLAIGVAIIYFAYNKYPEFASQTDYLIERFEDPKDNESNRERMDMYEGTYSAFLTSSIFEQLFGHGYMAVVNDLYGRPTHNDLMEILYDYGLMALVIYLIFLVKLFIRGFKSFCSNRKDIFLLFTMCNLFLLSMINCMITNPAFVFVNMFCIGFSLNCLQKYSSNEKISSCPSFRTHV